MPTLSSLDDAAPATSGEVLTALRDGIVRGELAPRRRLDDKALGKRLGQPRDDVRRALIRLVTEGLVARPDGQSFEVVPIFLERARDDLAVAGAVFTLAVEQGAARLTDADLRVLSSYRETSLSGDDAAMREAVRTTSIATVMLATLVARAGNPEIQRVRGWVLGPLERICWVHADHIELAPERDAQRALVDALVARDVHRTLRVWRSYVQVANARLLDSGLALVPEVLANDREPRPALVGQTASAIRHAILTGDLPPGAPLSERTLAARLHTPRARVADALTELAEQGVVDGQGERRVSQDDEATVARVLDLTSALHRLALSLAARGDRAALAATIGRHVSRLEVAADGRARMAAITALTDDIAYASGNGVLAEVAARLGARARWHVIHDPSLARAIDVDQLRAIQSAVAREDIRAADDYAGQLFARS